MHPHNIASPHKIGRGWQSAHIEYQLHPAHASAAPMLPKQSSKSRAMENRNNGTVKTRPTISKRRCSADLMLASFGFSVFSLATYFHCFETGAGNCRADLAWLTTVGTYFTRARSVVMLTEASSTPSSFVRAFSSLRASLSSESRLMTRSASPVATPYPARSTRATRSGVRLRKGHKVTVARSDERLTTAAWTPPCFFNPRSTVATQLAQVIPVMGRVSCFVSVIIHQ